jgi:hypothetical protein
VLADPDGWDAVEADFERDYDRDLRVEIDRMPDRRLVALVKGLGPGSALWRWKGERPDIVEALHAWGLAITELMTAKPRQRVQLPATPGPSWPGRTGRVRGEQSRRRRSLIDELKRALSG